MAPRGCAYELRSVNNGFVLNGHQISETHVVSYQTTLNLQ